MKLFSSRLARFHSAAQTMGARAASLFICLPMLTIGGCAGLHSMMGGNTREQALAAVQWGFAQDAIAIEIKADPRLNQYRGQSHTLLLGIYQTADAASFHRLVADPAALAAQLGGNDSGVGGMQPYRYVVAPGRHVLVLFDRAQNSRFVGVVAGYADLTVGNTRLFEVPAALSSSGWLAATYTAQPARTVLQLRLGADGILNAEPLGQADRLPTAAQQRGAKILDGGGKEITLNDENGKQEANDPISADK